LRQAAADVRGRADVSASPAFVEAVGERLDGPRVGDPEPGRDDPYGVAHHELLAASPVLLVATVTLVVGLHERVLGYVRQL
jgi:hypothetical protein